MHTFKGNNHKIILNRQKSNNIIIKFSFKYLLEYAEMGKCTTDVQLYLLHTALPAVRNTVAVCTTTAAAIALLTPQSILCPAAAFNN